MTVKHIPSNAGKKPLSYDPVELVKKRLTKALRPHFKGKTAEKRLEKAVKDSIEAIAPLITTQEVTGQKLGGTVMTEAASSRNPHTGNFGVAPRNI